MVTPALTITVSLALKWSIIGVSGDAILNPLAVSEEKTSGEVGASGKLRAGGLCWLHEFA